MYQVDGDNYIMTDFVIAGLFFIYYCWSDRMKDMELMELTVCMGEMKN
jgi:hypothetical protein